MKFHFRHESTNHGPVLVVSEPHSPSSHQAVTSSSASPPALSSRSRRRRSSRRSSSRAEGPNATNVERGADDESGGTTGSTRRRTRGFRKRSSCPTLGDPSSTPINATASSSAMPLSNSSVQQQQHPILTAKWSMPRLSCNPASSDDEDDSTNNGSGLRRRLSRHSHSESELSDCGGLSELSDCGNSSCGECEGGDRDEALAAMTAVAASMKSMDGAEAHGIDGAQYRTRSSRQFFRLGRHRSRKSAESVALLNVSNASFAGNSTIDSTESTWSAVSSASLTASITSTGSNSDASSASTSTEGNESKSSNLNSSPSAPAMSTQQVAKPRGIDFLRKPTMRRTMSLPIHGSRCPASENNAGSAETDKSTASSSTTSSDSSASLQENEVSNSTEANKSATITPTQKQGHHRRHVTFTTIQIRQYSRILGDHPCCPSGPPLSLGWNLEKEEQFNFENYEKQREPERSKSKDGMRLGCEVRREILESLRMVVPVTGVESSDDVSDSSSSGSSAMATPTLDSISLANEESADSSNEASLTTTTTCCVYTRAELRRAERRLEKERAGNHRVQRRVNKSFFRPLTEAERTMEGAATAIPHVAEESSADVGEGASAATGAEAA